MKKAFRWSCVILSVFTLCAWALLLREANQPWKTYGMNGMSNSSLETKPGEKQIEKNAALAKAEPASPREGDRMLDPVVLQQEQQQEESPEIHGTAGMLFMGPGPGAAKSRHHRAKKSSETDVDSSAETREKTDEVILASADHAEDSRLVQTLIPSTSLPSTSALALLPTMGLSVPSTVNNTTQTLVERITSPAGMTVNDLTRGISSAPQTRLQSLVNTTQSILPNSSSVGTIVGSVSSTVGTLVGNTTTALQSPVQTLTSQMLGTVSSVTGTISSVPANSTTISGSPISPMVITPSSTSSAVAASSTSSLVVSPASTSSFAVSPVSISSTAVSSSAVSSMAVSPAVTSSVPTTLSSSLIGTSIGPQNPLRPALPGGH